LYFRINTIEIHLPPLRERMDDVPLLADHFLKSYSEKYNRKIQGFSQKAYDQMLNYSWRGNIRELQHAIERAVLLSKGNNIEMLNIQYQAPSYSVSTASAGTAASSPVSTVSETNVVSQPMSQVESAAAQESEKLSELAKLDDKSFFEEIGKIIVGKIPNNSDGEENEDIFNNIEYGVVLAALQRAKHNKQAAASLLGIYRPRLYGMIKRHNLEEE
jgi:DNA-binding NtrC family response regulator